MKSPQTSGWGLIGIVALCLGATAPLVCATPCDTCGRAVRGDYFALSDSAYCSEDCLSMALPQCAACSRPMRGTMLRSDTDTFCSLKCFKTSLPTCELCGAQSTVSVSIGDHVYCRQHGRAERCDGCRLPFVDGSHLNDGRNLCSTCEKAAVMSRDVAEKLFARAIRETTLVTGLASDSAPRLYLVGVDALTGGTAANSNSNSDMYESGRYHRHARKTIHKNLFGVTVKEKERVTESISILYGLAPDRFLATASHELTHDLLAEFYPRSTGAPAWLHEGVCQYVASEVCRRNQLSNAVARIATHEGAVYGNGFRYFMHRFGVKNWAGVDAFLRNTDLAELPEAAPSHYAATN